jgi:pimeloyl-ACP methyl ester carboxylesterase
MRDLAAFVPQVHVVIHDHARDTIRVQPETRYATSGDYHIAYQVIGDGPLELVFGPPFVTHLELLWEDPRAARFLRRLATFSRLIVFDKRGTGLSDRVPGDALPPLEERMDDVRAVMDAAGVERAALFGSSEGGLLCALFAATYPERTAALVLHATYPRAIQDDEFPEGWLPAADVEPWLAEMRSSWVEGRAGRRLHRPGDPEDRLSAEWFMRMMRVAVSPGAAVALGRMAIEADVRPVLPTIQAPTLVIVRRDDENAPASRYMAERIPGAKYVELDGEEHVFWLDGPEEQDEILAEIEEHLTGMRPIPEADRVLATVLFTDVVASTELAAQLGDRRWADLLERHNELVRREVSRFRGREIDTAGDGFFAVFDGPARTIRCASSVVDTAHTLGIEIRAGVHTGECELSGDKVRGLAVHTGARVAALAQPGEVLVTNTVKDLVSGSGIEFADRGVTKLKGVPGEWHLFAAQSHD